MEGMRLGTLLVVAASACFQPRPPEGAPCNTGNECPAPLQCHAGTCQRMPGDSAVGDDAAIVDAPRDGAPACAPPSMLPPFPSPALVMSLSTADADGTPSLTADLLEIYIKSDRIGGLGGGDVWKATRASVGAAWDPPVNVTEVNSAASDVGTEVSPDGLTLYFSSNRAGGAGRLDFYVSTRPNRSAAWSAPVRIAELSSPESDEGIFVSPSGLVAYFHSDRDAATPGVYTIYRATRTSVQVPWSTPVRVAELDSGTGDENPWVTADDCTMYFQSERSGGDGSADIWVARRATPASPFGAVTNLSTINGAAYDADPWLSPDERTILFVSPRGAVGDYDVYEAAR
jgi:Tol biopolymer transport system component